jgi:hypothetical protein
MDNDIEKFRGRRNAHKKIGHIQFKIYKMDNITTVVDTLNILVRPKIGSKDLRNLLN